MGFPLSSILTDIYVHFFECLFVNKFSLTFRTHYIDDKFTLMDTSLHNIDNILNIIKPITTVFNLLKKHKIMTHSLSLVPKTASPHPYIAKVLLFFYHAMLAQVIVLNKNGRFLYLYKTCYTRLL